MQSICANWTVVTSTYLCWPSPLFHYNPKIIVHAVHTTHRDVQISLPEYSWQNYTSVFRVQTIAALGLVPLAYMGDNPWNSAQCPFHRNGSQRKRQKLSWLLRSILRLDSSAGCFVRTLYTHKNSLYSQEFFMLRRTLYTQKNSLYSEELFMLRKTLYTQKNSLYSELFILRRALYTQKNSLYFFKWLEGETSCQEKPLSFTVFIHILQ